MLHVIFSVKFSFRRAAVLLLLQLGIIGVCGRYSGCRHLKFFSVLLKVPNNKGCAICILISNADK